MHIFYAPDILSTKELPIEEAQHCMRVLRLKTGDEVVLTDGKGFFYKAAIDVINQKQCRVNLLETIPQTPAWKNEIEIALAPTKNIDRTEWFVEKATEIGINSISFLNCRYSERKEIKLQRMERILISAMKQSQKATLPQLHGMIDFNKFIGKNFKGKKYIAHCYPGMKRLLSQIYEPGENVLILIGPEGDFSEDEVTKAVKEGFEPVSLGESRLRTETAALAACHTIHIINEKKSD